MGEPGDSKGECDTGSWAGRAAVSQSPMDGADGERRPPACCTGTGAPCSEEQCPEERLPIKEEYEPRFSETSLVDLPTCVSLAPIPGPRIQLEEGCSDPRLAEPEISKMTKNRAATSVGVEDVPGGSEPVPR